ncbi:hypothetical protein N658DRAFT_137514 [Parathielavia hyrcaniae]|uniref:Uncharacterized protein n=1 Tax=Parathielavia hyrcaniae TaxID=113614 RepID=A0AAN6Q984_9PEZI|nr:hypothetical protein N658DRAFT_137514 [Parathielavia hyrcaniae]
MSSQPSRNRHNIRTLNENDEYISQTTHPSTRITMAPTANTARQRRVTGSARTPAETDSDAEYQAYNGRLKEASAARTRLRKVRGRPRFPSFYRLACRNPNPKRLQPGQTIPRQEPRGPRHSTRCRPPPNRIPRPKVRGQARRPAVRLQFSDPSCSRPPPSSQPHPLSHSHKLS